MVSDRLLGDQKGASADRSWLLDTAPLDKTTGVFSVQHLETRCCTPASTRHAWSDEAVDVNTVTALVCHQA